MQVGLISTLGGGGVGRFTNQLIQGLSNKEEVQIVLFRVDSRADYEVPIHNHITQKYSPNLRSPLLSRIKALVDLSLKKLQLEIVHSNYASNASLVRFKGNMILTMHGFPRPEIESNLVDKIAYTFEQWCLSYLPDNIKIITISQYCRSKIKERYGLETEVIYNGVDCNFFSPSPNRDFLKYKMGFQGKTIILFISRLHALKDPLTLVKAYREVAKRINDSILVIVGTGPLKEKILELSSYYNIPIVVKDSSYGTDLLSLYQCADLFVLPSIGESFGLVLAEAMSCGCPCLASNSGACPEILGTNDLLFEPGNINSLAEKMLYLLQNPNESENVTEYLTRRAKMQFSSEEMTDKYYNLYRSVLK